MNLWRSCAADWRSPDGLGLPGSVANPEGILLRALLDAGIFARRVPGLYLTVYREDGAECARLKAYRRGDGRSVFGECERSYRRRRRIFSEGADSISAGVVLRSDQVSRRYASTDPRKSRDTPAEALLIYTFLDAVEVKGEAFRADASLPINLTTWRDDVGAKCASLAHIAAPFVGHTRKGYCLDHLHKLGNSMKIMEEARHLRLILWDDSFISSPRFADYQIKTRGQWDAFALAPRDFLQAPAEKLESEATGPSLGQSSRRGRPPRPPRDDPAEFRGPRIRPLVSSLKEDDRRLGLEAGRRLSLGDAKAVWS